MTTVAGRRIDVTGTVQGVGFPPDLATRDARLRKPTDRRFRYRFLNCTHVGSRCPV